MRNRIKQSLDEHRQIAAALAVGDAEAAAHAAREHVLIQGQRFSDLISVSAPL
jgi:DNA-binding GntR family transcriptional regulator